jgi:ABC-type branched-subunit amino acid transport system ATPase component
MKASGPERLQTQPLLEIRNVSRSFYGVEALRGASFEVESGRITGLIGPNGAGKTTLFNCISGLVPPTAGRIVFDGRDITGARPDRIARSGLARTFQIARGLARLSVLDNLLLHGRDQPGEGVLVSLFGRGALRRREEELTERALVLARRLGLSRLIGERAANLSGGQKKLLEIGRALMGEPKLILLDEPVAGVNPTLAREIGAHLRALVAEGVSFLLIEHQMDMISRLCDRVIVMAEGRRLTEGTFAELAADERVQHAYMGRRR